MTQKQSFASRAFTAFRPPSALSVVSPPPPLNRTSSPHLSPRVVTRSMSQKQHPDPRLVLDGVALVRPLVPFSPLPARPSLTRGGPRLGPRARGRPALLRALVAVVVPEFEGRRAAGAAAADSAPTRARVLGVRARVSRRRSPVGGGARGVRPSGARFFFSGGGLERRGGGSGLGAFLARDDPGRDRERGNAASSLAGPRRMEGVAAVAFGAAAVPLGASRPLGVGSRGVRGVALAPDALARLFPRAVEGGVVGRSWRRNSRRRGDSPCAAPPCASLEFVTGCPRARRMCLIAVLGRP